MGGAQRYVFDLATNLDKNQHEILVAIGSEKTELRNELEKKNINVMIVKNLVRNIHPLKDFLAVLELKKLILKFQPDILHLNSSKAGFLGSIAGRLAAHENIIFTAHGFAFLEPKNILVKKIYLFAERIADKFRKLTITVSDSDRESALRYHIGEQKKFKTIHNGIDLSKNLKSRAECRAELERVLHAKIATEDFLVGSIAHNYKTKDLPTLYKAVEISQKQDMDIKLVAIGHGATYGTIARADELLPGFDLYVCSSIKEGFPYTILEAMNAGVPIVSTNVGGIPEAIQNEKEGLLVSPKNPQALAQAMLRIISDAKLRETLARSAKEKVKQFSLGQMLDKTNAVYQEVLSSQSE